MNTLENNNLLMEETVFCEGLQLQNRFWQDLSTRQFHVSVTCGKESASAALGKDPLFAADCYRKIRDGGVTPCTLEDIVCDLTKLEKNEKTLYKM